MKRTYMAEIVFGSIVLFLGLNAEAYVKTKEYLFSGVEPEKIETLVEYYRPVSYVIEPGTRLALRK